MSFSARPRHPVTGRRLYVSAPTERELRAKLRELAMLRLEHREGAATSDDVAALVARVRVGKVTVQRAGAAYTERRDLSRNTRRAMEAFLRGPARSLAARELRELDGPRVAAWLRELAGEKRAAASVAHAWRMLRALVRHASELGWIAGAPWGAFRPTRAMLGRVGRDRLPREAARSPVELTHLLAACEAMDGEHMRRQRRPLGLLPRAAAAALAGLRQRELAGLAWPDVLIAPDGGGVVLAVLRASAAADRTKQGTVDMVAAGPELAGALSAWRATLQACGWYEAAGPIFPCPWLSVRGRPRPYPERAEVLRAPLVARAAERAGLAHPERWTAHSLRDSFVTLEAAALGGDLAAVAKRSRHASLSSLVRYLRARSRAEVPAPSFVLPPLEPPPGALPARSSSPPEPGDEELAGAAPVVASRGDAVR